MANPACFSLSCLEDSMSGWFREDLLGDPVDDINSLSSKITRNANRFSFHETLGETGISSKYLI